MARSAAWPVPSIIDTWHHLRSPFRALLADMVRRFNVNGRYYVAYSTLRTHAGARQVCATNGLQLLHYSWATQEQETAVNNVVLNMYPNQPVWLGATDQATEGRYVWEDGKPVTTTRWNVGEPNNVGDEDCLELLNGSNRGLWNDLPCTATRPFVCMEATTCFETGQAVSGRLCSARNMHSGLAHFLKAEQPVRSAMCSSG